jgi:hypothetical protein
LNSYLKDLEDVQNSHETELEKIRNNKKRVKSQTINFLTESGWKEKWKKQNATIATEDRRYKFSLSKN